MSGPLFFGELFIVGMDYYHRNGFGGKYSNKTTLWITMQLHSVAQKDRPEGGISVYPGALVVKKLLSIKSFTIKLGYPY